MHHNHVYTYTCIRAVKLWASYPIINQVITTIYYTYMYEYNTALINEHTRKKAVHITPKVSFEEQIFTASSHQTCTHYPSKKLYSVYSGKILSHIQYYIFERLVCCKICWPSKVSEHMVYHMQTKNPIPIIQYVINLLYRTVYSEDKIKAKMSHGCLKFDMQHLCTYWMYQYL